MSVRKLHSSVKTTDLGPFGRIVKSAHRQISLACDIPSWMQLQLCPSSHVRRLLTTLGRSVLLWPWPMPDKSVNLSYIQIGSKFHGLLNVIMMRTHCPFTHFWAKIKHNFVHSEKKCKSFSNLIDANLSQSNKPVLERKSVFTQMNVYFKIT